jgi:glycosyltransferase involved in cell wall biosynthesis
MKDICFVLTTPFAVNAFLLGHLRALAGRYHVSLCVNLDLYPISPRLDPRVRVINLGIQRKISPLNDLRTLWHLIRLFRGARFDAVHSMTPKAGLLSMLAGLIARVPRRYHTFTGQVWANRAGFSRFVFKFFDRMIVTFSTRVFADSKSQCCFLEAEGVVNREEAQVLGLGSVCGVDLNRFRPNAQTRSATRASLLASPNTCVFLFVGRLVRDKGVFDLIEAYSRLEEQGRDVALWIAGPDEDGLLAELKKKAGTFEPRIRWLGATFEPERFMAGADVLVLPSYREGFGMVIVEAAASGIPSIAYRIDGVTDAIRDGETGLLITKGNVEELTDTMYSLVDNSPARHKLGAKALSHVRKNFSDRAVSEAWLAFYRRELGG